MPAIDFHGCCQIKNSFQIQMHGIKSCPLNSFLSHKIFYCCQFLSFILYIFLNIIVISILCLVVQFHSSSNIELHNIEFLFLSFSFPFCLFLCNFNFIVAKNWIDIFFNLHKLNSINFHLKNLQYLNEIKICWIFNLIKFLVWFFSIDWFFKDWV